MLPKIIANEYVLEQTTRNYHWNVEGSLFLPLHNLFGDQYSKLSEIIDTLNELLRQEGEMALDRHEMEKESDIPDEIAQDWGDMVANLYNMHEHMKAQLASEIPAAQDPAVQNALIETLAWHKKQCWFLGMHLTEDGQESPEHEASESPSTESVEKELNPNEDADVQQANGSDGLMGPSANDSNEQGVPQRPEYDAEAGDGSVR